VAVRADQLDSGPPPGEMIRSASGWLGVLLIVLSWLASTTWRFLRAVAPSPFHDPELDDGRD